jgi:6-pyruvoyltetrahydropterin 2'-reductase
MKVAVSEYFFSIQGEGISAGVPCFFIRFPGCNLACGGHNGSLVKSGKANWWCDTEALWREMREVDTSELFNSLEPAQLEALSISRAHIVFTGGEPCLVENTEYAQSILDAWAKVFSPRPFLEVETNGTVFSHLLDIVDQINCSPKLSNSGMSKVRRIQPEVLRYISHRSLDVDVQFKFVIHNLADVEEMMEDYVNAGLVPRGKVVLMPAADSQKELAETTRFVWEVATKMGLRMCSRLHVLCYGKKAGV